MPLRPLTRDQAWLLPPSLDDLVPVDHPVRFVAAFVDTLAAADWAALGVVAGGAAEGAPAFDPRVLLGVWLYGFMTGVRSTRRLEAACIEQVPYLWLTGTQRPDHNTLWRFYEAHRAGMRTLLRRTVRTAVRAGLVDLALQAVDGTKVQAAAATSRTHDATGLARILSRTETAIADLEGQAQTGGEAGPVRLPARLTQLQALRAQVQTAAAQVAAAAGPEQVNLTDADATLMKSRRGVVAGYNAQAMVVGLDAAVAGRTGLLITAALVTTDPDDHAQLLPMVAEAAAVMEQPAAVTLADAGYHSGANLAACAERGLAVRMAEAQTPHLSAPYHKEQFVHDPATDTYRCPQGQVLIYRGDKQRAGRPLMRVYRGTGAVCRACPAFGTCTRDRRMGRALEVGPHEGLLRAHRAMMATAAAQAQYKRRQTLPEPAFGVLKEQQGARRVLRRGLAKVRDEWLLLATAFNLRTLAAVARAGPWRRTWPPVGAG